MTWWRLRTWTRKDWSNFPATRGIARGRRGGRSSECSNTSANAKGRTSSPWTPEYKYVRGSDGREALYDVRTKPRERRDCLADRPERARRLRGRLDAWQDSFEHAAVDPDADVEMAAETERHLESLGYL